MPVEARRFAVRPWPKPRPEQWHCRRVTLVVAREEVRHMARFGSHHRPVDEEEVERKNCSQPDASRCQYETGAQKKAAEVERISRICIRPARGQPLVFAQMARCPSAPEEA